MRIFIDFLNEIILGKCEECHEIVYFGKSSDDSPPFDEWVDAMEIINKTIDHQLVCPGQGIKSLLE